MHGRPRKAPNEEEQGASALQAAKLRDLQSQVLQFHHNKIYTEEAIEISAKLLESNPEHYTGWNYRKLCVQYRLDQLSEDGAGSESIQSIFDEELRLVENALKKNFKSYGAWHHRKWVLSKGHSSTDRELRLLGRFQKLDARNFHAWNYRRFIAALKKIPDEEEFKYTTDMICDNFSNYSAWHNRSILLSNLLEKGGKGFDSKGDVLGDEYEFVCNALFTDPDDQSGWFYHLWLLDQTFKLEPVFLSSWPPRGSNLYISINGSLKGQQTLPILEFHSKEGTFPLVLYFSDAVKGVSSSTVIIDYQAADNIVWRPLFETNCGFSRTWLTYLKFPDEMRCFEAVTVKVTVASSQGITSSSGLPCNQCCDLSFSILVRYDELNHSETKTIDRISWKDEHYKALPLESQEVNLPHLLSILETTQLNKECSPKWGVELISREIAHCQELLSTTNCKIGKLTLARLLMAHNTLMLYGIQTHYEDILALYQDLMKMDPAHIWYYEDEYSWVLFKQLTSDKASLLKHCYQYQEPLLSSVNSYLCVRLNGLSLSRFGSMENLLWIQMLDLSHNKLRSIEGLEALQLLSCLKLSHNRFLSFTTLEPLKVLKYLKVLDISHNEIGAHSIDTRRYLCSSPLNHTVGSDWNFKRIVGGDIQLKGYWDAYLLFKDSNLVQLEIAGNAVVDDRFRAFLLKLMPELKWLDSEECH